MSQKKSKLLRKIANLTSRTDDYIKKQFKEMPKDIQLTYLEYMRENLRRAKEMEKNETENSISVDTKLA